MKVLIAISSCERDAQNGFNQAMRESWIRGLPSELEYKFFTGRGVREPEADEVRLDVEDDYESLPYKTRESLRWALDHGYEYIFRAFTDTCIHPQRLLTSGFEQHDYFGHFPGGYNAAPDAKGHYCYASGGPGYGLSRRAAIAVVNSEPDHWAEDLWVGDVMGRNGILGTHSDALFFKWSRPLAHTISVHLSRGTNVYEAPWMHDCYLELLNS